MEPAGARCAEDARVRDGRNNAGREDHPDPFLPPTFFEFQMVAFFR